MAKRRDSEDARDGGWLFALGAGAGLAVGMYLGTQRQGPELSRRERLVRGARTAAQRLRPARMRHEDRDQSQLRRLEDAVLNGLVRDDLLAERPIDVGAISAGIIELSGSVRTRAEAERAVALAEQVRGVEGVVNRLQVETDVPRGRAGAEGREWGGRMAGMGRRRQGHETDPARADDAQDMRERSLEQADRAQLEDEGISHSQPRMAARTGPARDPNPTRYSEDELDNQTPFGQHAVPVPEQPQELNADSRVGEGLKPGTELRLEQSDVPVKPHGDPVREDRLDG